MKYRILIPFWGSAPKYTRLLTEWFEAYKRSGCTAPVTLITDQKTQKFGTYDWQTFEVPEPNEYIFDTKGEIVCAAIQQVHEPLLVLDSDATLQADPEPLLWPFHEDRFAMPLDEGCYGMYIRNRHAQPTRVPKRCAGVLWFGSAQGRAALVGEYRRAFVELNSGRYYEERRLFEQHAWSFVAYWNNCPILPRELNWLDIHPQRGFNPTAAINHRVGQRKFRLA